MAEDFFALSFEDQKDALDVAAAKSGRPAHILYKDIWVVWALKTLFEAPVGARLVFKGGTSLSKAFGLIRRFSEDIDLTYDIRAIAPDLAGRDDYPLPATRSQARKWSKAVRERLPQWIDETVLPLIEGRLTTMSGAASIRREDDKAALEYKPIHEGSGYISPSVILEFGARSTGEPSAPREITCDAAPALPDVSFPTARPKVMRPERTFWEKSTAIHVYCRRGEFRGADGFARHWYDLACLDEGGVAAKALADRSLREAVAAHKSYFFAEKDADGASIDYQTAVNGGLCLVPTGAALEALVEDYQRMIEEGLFFDDAPSFDDLIRRCADLERRANN